MKEAILRKVRESAETSWRFFESHAPRLEACVIALAERFRAGGRLLVIGNGGTACDPQHVTVEFHHPLLEKRRALPAIALGCEVALLTAIGNDADFSQVYAVQIDRLATEHDAVLGISTSGASTNVLRGLDAARRRGLPTIGFAGRDGGGMADRCDHLFVVPSWSTHRIQEAHTILLHLLWDQVHVALGEDDVL